MSGKQQKRKILLRLTVEQQGLKFCAENSLLRRRSFGSWLMGENIALEWTPLGQSISVTASFLPAA